MLALLKLKLDLIFTSCNWLKTDLSSLVFSTRLYRHLIFTSCFSNNRNDLAHFIVLCCVNFAQVENTAEKTLFAPFVTNRCIVTLRSSLDDVYTSTDVIRAPETSGRKSVLVYARFLLSKTTSCSKSPVNCRHLIMQASRCNH